MTPVASQPVKMIISDIYTHIRDTGYYKLVLLPRQPCIRLFQCFEKMYLSLQLATPPSSPPSSPYLLNCLLAHSPTPAQHIPRQLLAWHHGAHLSLSTVHRLRTQTETQTPILAHPMTFRRHRRHVRTSQHARTRPSDNPGAEPKGQIGTPILHEPLLASPLEEEEEEEKEEPLLRVSGGEEKGLARLWKR